MSGGQPLLLREFSKFNSTLKHISETSHFELNGIIFSIWYKVDQHLDALQHSYSPADDFNMQTIFGMMHTRCWAQLWRALGVSLGLDELSNRSIQCKYPRCAVPDTPLAWECADCNIKCYCSRRCQQAYVRTRFCLLVRLTCNCKATGCIPQIPTCLGVEKTWRK
jgi:hypothetical protein